MSSKHLRRLIEEQEKEKARAQGEITATVSEAEDDGEVEAPRAPAVNRFTFLGDDSGSEKNYSEEETEPAAVKEPAQKQKETSTMVGKQKNKKKKKGAKKQTVESDDDDQLLEKLAKQNAVLSLEEGTSSEPLDFKQGLLNGLLKVDPKKFDPRAELKAVLGKTFKEPQTNKSKAHDGVKRGGRIVKQNFQWPPVKNIGLTMVKDEENKTKFKFVFNNHYEMLERMALMGERTMTLQTAQEIIQSEFWHLHSLLLLANASLMQDDITNAMDFVERGIFFCEQNFHSCYDYTDISHRLKYMHYENRAFYLFLHKYMLLCVKKRCFDTALNYAKLICTLDVGSDPLAMFLYIDTLAIKAKKYDWLKQLCHAYSDNKKMTLLPNFAYSKAMGLFLTAKTEEEKQAADKLLEEAIQQFPGVVTHLIDVLQLHVDTTIDGNAFLGPFAFGREHEGFKWVVKIYVHLSQELWKVPETLLWLENVSRKVAMGSHKPEIRDKMTKWKDRRHRMFVGIPEEVRRLSVLLGISNEATSLTDPISPTGSVNKYLQPVPREAVQENMFSSFINSLLPDYDPSTSLTDRIRHYTPEGDVQALYQWFSSWYGDTTGGQNNNPNNENN